MSDYRRIEVTRAEASATITLNRQSGGNALDLLTVQEILSALTALTENAAVAAILIDSKGHDFCVGGDIGFIYKEHAKVEEKISEMVSVWHESLALMSECRQTVIVAVQGAVAGGGLGFVLAADYVMAAKNTRFAAGFSRLGLSCDSGLSWFLPRAIGLKRSKQFLLAEKGLDADQAFDWGLVDELVEKSDLRQRSMQILEKTAGNASSATLSIKQLLNASGKSDLKAQLDLEKRVIVERAVLDEVENNVERFLNVKGIQFR